MLCETVFPEIFLKLSRTFEADLSFRIYSIKYLSGQNLGRISYFFLPESAKMDQKGCRIVSQCQRIDSSDHIFELRLFTFLRLTAWFIKLYTAWNRGWSNAICFQGSNHLSKSQIYTKEIWNLYKFNMYLMKSQKAKARIEGWLYISCVKSGVQMMNGISRPCLITLVGTTPIYQSRLKWFVSPTCTHINCQSFKTT